MRRTLKYLVAVSVAIIIERPDVFTMLIDAADQALRFPKVSG